MRERRSAPRTHAVAVACARHRGCQARCASVPALCVARRRRRMRRRQGTDSPVVAACAAPESLPTD
eukprot:1350453-Pleurochrysis_carterae.AAC.1